MINRNKIDEWVMNSALVVACSGATSLLIPIVRDVFEHSRFENNPIVRKYNEGTDEHRQELKDYRIIRNYEEWQEEREKSKPFVYGGGAVMSLGMLGMTAGALLYNGRNMKGGE